jgi:hypothetical protein
MANNISSEKKTLAISMLCEGSSIRSIERITGIHRDTIMRLGVRVGEACAKIMDEKMRNLNCEQIQVDEIWGFIGKKKKQLRDFEFLQGMGDVWTFIALDTSRLPVAMLGRTGAAKKTRMSGLLRSWRFRLWCHLRRR